MKVKGKSLMIRLGGHTIALSTNCTFDCTLNTLDGKTKQDNGANDIPDDITWSVSCESLLGMNAGTEQHTYATLMELFLAKQRVEVEVMLAGNTIGAVPLGDWKPGPYTSKGFTPYGGEALIKSLSLSGDTGNSAKISIQLSGQGELRKIDYQLTARVEGNTLILDGPVEVGRDGLLIEGDASVIDKTLNL